MRPLVPICRLSLSKLSDSQSAVLGNVIPPSPYNITNAIEVTYTKKDSGATVRGSKPINKPQNALYPNIREMYETPD